MGNPQAVKTAIGNRVNRLYGSSIFGVRPIAPIPLPGSIMSAFATEDPGSAETTATSSAPVVRAWHPSASKQSSDTTTEKEAVVTAAAAHVPLAGPGHPAVAEALTPPNLGFFDWTARIEFKKYELNDSFAVLLFLGEVPTDPHDWLVSPNYVGSHYAFVNTSASQCANCVSQADLVVEGFVHLNEAIIKHAGFSSLDASVVEPYLKQNLHWKVFKVRYPSKIIKDTNGLNFHQVPGVVANLSSLEVSVYVTPLSYPPHTLFPVPGERSRRSGITHGREGGCRHASA